MTPDEIKIGDRFERDPPGTSGVRRGAVVSYEGADLWTLKMDDGGTAHCCSLRREWWRRLPREQTIEERRAALKAGDVIREPELLCGGMRIRLRQDCYWAYGIQSSVGNDVEVAGMSGHDVLLRTKVVYLFGPSLYPSWIRNDGVTYLGMAGKQPAGEGIDYPMVNGAREKLCDETQCDFHGVAHECVRARHRKSTMCAPDCTPATPCRRSALVCPVFREEALAVRLAAETRTARSKLDKMEAARWREPRQPSPTGLGGMVGRYRFNR